ncbi:DNA-binding transcriptional regulator, AcrR family [Pseudarcicella hirudinis]|uniref:DNA-binding transcriptional regulator, AcrR family n=1 Tax=Pseudarcicella hirudinis TaxID=1079859 RepID=A0A1I5UYF8_9BACT|nr:TetR/AcrR family transcriptional regulator [Pseudarcicella hirudinis]SFQ00260.1 DNA-binding transcriptional regulator, AcrR family [Pseudarcicella hirudinis]
MKEFDKKEAIFNAMLELIVKHGFHASPMSDVAKHANVAAGTIYHYFKSKDELICALYVRHKEQMNEILFKNDDPSRLFKDRFRIFYLLLFNHYTKNKNEFIFLEQFINSPFVNTFSRADLQKFDQPTYDFIRKAIFTQVLRDISPKILISMIMGSAHALIKLQLSGEYNISLSELETAFLVCWDGIKRP